MSNANFSSVSPLESFYAVSGLEPVKLKIILAIIFVSVLLLAYMWANNNGYKFMVNNGDIWSFFKLILWGAALILCVISFFIY